MAADDPTSRRRWDPEDQRIRDAEILRLYHAGVSHRGIAKQLKCSLGTVQHVLRREQKLRQQRQQSLEREFGAELDAALAKYDDPALLAHEVKTVEDIARLNDLEYYRLRHLPLDHPVRAVWGLAVKQGYRRPEPHTGRVCSDDGPSWRQGAARALSGDSGSGGDVW